MNFNFKVWPFAVLYKLWNVKFEYKFLFLQKQKRLVKNFVFEQTFKAHVISRKFLCNLFIQKYSHITFVIDTVGPPFDAKTGKSITTFDTRQLFFSRKYYHWTKNKNTNQNKINVLNYALVFLFECRNDLQVHKESHSVKSANTADNARYHVHIIKLAIKLCMRIRKSTNFPSCYSFTAGCTFASRQTSLRASCKIVAC